MHRLHVPGLSEIRKPSNMNILTACDIKRIVLCTYLQYSTLNKDALMCKEHFIVVVVKVELICIT